MYELGFAHALRKPTILLIDFKSSDSQLPADLAGFEYFSYDRSDLRRLALRLKIEMNVVTTQPRLIIGRDALFRGDALSAGIELFLPLSQAVA